MQRAEATKDIKIPLDPGTQATTVLDGQSRICNWLYNTLLEHAKVLRHEFIQTQDPAIAKTVYTERGLRNLIPKMKEEHPFLKVVHSSPLKNSALRLSQAIQTHQKSKKGKRRGKRVGFPKFRSWKAAWFSLLYDEPNKGFKVEDNNLILSLGMGQDRKHRSLTIPIKQAEVLKDKEIRTLRIVKEHGCFYAVFTVRTILPATKPLSRIVALDPNHKNLVYGVDNDGVAFEIAAPDFLKVYDRRIDELKSKRDRCKRQATQVAVVDEKGVPTGKTYWEPSQRWKKYHKALERALKKRREQTNTFLYTTAHHLYSQYDCVGIGDYTPSGGGSTTKMRRAINNRSLIGRFKEALAWVAAKSGKVFMEYNEQGTTRTCHCCRHSVEGGIALDVREWACPECKAFHLRDENAGKNGLLRVVKDLQKRREEMGYEGPLFSRVSGSDRVFVKKRWALRVLPSGVRCAPRGQGRENIAA
jgi:putative transposase